MPYLRGQGDLKVMTDIPSGFSVLPTESPFVANVGPLYAQAKGRAVVMGLRVSEKHSNRLGRLHGAMVCAGRLPLPLMDGGLSARFSQISRPHF